MSDKVNNTLESLPVQEQGRKSRANKIENPKSSKPFPWKMYEIKKEKSIFSKIYQFLT